MVKSKQIEPESGIHWECTHGSVYMCIYIFLYINFIYNLVAVGLMEVCGH